MRFFHPTFQEYFAALAIDDWQEDFFNHFPDNPTQGIYRIFEPQWKEVILLWLGRESVSNAEKEAFIKVLVEFDDKCGNFYGFKAYFMAASGVSEFKDCLRTNEIVDQVVKWHINNDFVLETSKLIQEMPRIKTIEYLVSYLFQLLNKLANQPKAIRFYFLNQLSYIIFSLKNIGVGNEMVINALIKLLKSSYVIENESCLHNIKVTLNQVCTNEENSINALLTFLELQGRDRDKLTQLIQKLSIRNRDDKRIIYVLVSMIEPQDMYDYNQQPEENLEQVENKTVLDDLVEWLYSMDDNILRLAAERLKKIDQSNEKALETLIELLDLADETNSNDWLVVESLKQILQQNQFATVITKFKKNLHNSQSKNYNLCQSIIWHCAQNMPYPDFYQAWHQYNF